MIHINKSEIWSLLVCKNSNPPSYLEKLSFHETHFLTEECLAGFIFELWNHSLPSRLEPIFKKEHHSNVARNLYLTESLNKLSGIFSGKKATLLKGMSLINKVHTLGERAMEDIDIYLPKKHWADVEKGLLKFGYSLQPEPRWTANQFKRVYVNLKGPFPVYIELHSQLFYTEPSDFFWETIKEGDSEFYNLKPEHQLLHLMGHYAFQHTFLSPKWLVDIDRFIRKTGDDLDWDLVYKDAQRLHQLKSASLVLGFSQKLLKTPLPNHFLNRLPKVSSHLYKRVFTSEFLLSPQRGALHYLLAKHLVKDSLFDHIRYDYHWLKNQLRPQWD